MNKELIRARFAKNLKNYNDNAKIQMRMAEKLSNLVKNTKVKNILEIGCGTGFLTKIVNNRICFESYTAIDIVPECKDFIKEINSEIKFLVEDIESFIINNKDERFDLIISNATLQWTNNFEKTVKYLQKMLTSNGELVFSTFGEENFREIYHILGTSLEYYSIRELATLFPEAIIEPEIHIMSFESPKDVLRHLQLTGVNAIEERSWTKKDLMRFENGYNNLCPQRTILTYNPVYLRIPPIG